MTRVLLVDDHVLFRKRLLEIFSGEPDVTVVGEACDGGTAVALAAEHRPDVVLLDVEIPGDDAVDTVIGLLAESPMTGVVIMSPRGETPVVRELRAAGPRTWLLPTVTRDDLVAAVHGVRAHVGRAVVPLPRARPEPTDEAGTTEPDSTEPDGTEPDALEPSAEPDSAGATAVEAGATAVEAEAEAAETNAAKAVNGNGHKVNGYRPLSQREVEVVQLAAGTLTHSQIAEQLAISESTVRRHVRHIVRKLGVASLGDAVDKANEMHLITPAVPASK